VTLSGYEILYKPYLSFALNFANFATLAPLRKLLVTNIVNSIIIIPALVAHHLYKTAELVAR